MLTAVEDYLRETEQALRSVKLPGYAGLGILCPAPLEWRNGDLAEFLKAWDFPPAVQEFYEQLDQTRSALLVRLMEQGQAGGRPAVDRKGVGDGGGDAAGAGRGRARGRAGRGGAAPAFGCRRRPRPPGATPARIGRAGGGGPPEPLVTGAPAIDLPGPSGPGVAIRYDDDAFVVTDKNLMGRRVAGRDFLDAYLRHGRWDELVALVANPPSEKSIQQLFESHPAGRPRGRRLRVVAQQGFHRAFFPGPPAPCCTSPGRWSRASPGRGSTAARGPSRSAG